MNSCWLFLLIFVVKKLCLEGRIFFQQISSQFQKHIWNNYIGHFPWILYLVPETSTLKRRLFQLDDEPNPFTTGKWLVGNHPTSMNKKWLFRVPGSTCPISLVFLVFHSLPSPFPHQGTWCSLCNSADLKQFVVGI